MSIEKKEHLKEKSKLHPRNKHVQRYDFKLLIKETPKLASFVRPNPYGDESIDFFNPEAVKTLNKALLKTHYQIGFWEIPNQYLCPPIPGRADYIHYIADLLKESNEGVIPQGEKIKALDIGTGASCIYSILGNREYGWSFISTEIDFPALKSARNIVEKNESLKGNIEIRKQDKARDIFDDVLAEDEFVDVSICNPPFHSSLEEAQSGNLRKLKNLTSKKTTEAVLNFGGQSNELWCKGGEKRFVQDMIYQSRHLRDSCFWFSSLVSKQSNLIAIEKTLKKVGVEEFKVINMGQGNKISRIVVWTFLSPPQQKAWRQKRWSAKEEK